MTQRTVLTFVAGVLLVSALAAVWVWRDYDDFIHRPLANLDHSIRFVVEPGSGLISVARELERQGYIDHPRYLVWYARREGRADTIVAGEYLLTPGMTPMELVGKLIRGDVIRYALTIPEGWTFRQFIETLRANGRLRHTLDGLDEAAIMSAIGHPSESPEGRFFPDTYQFITGTTDADLLRQAYQAMKEKLSSVWEERAPDLPLKTPYQALILASIIEKETSVAEERRRVAGVYIRRLQRGMRLQADPTVIYGIGLDFDGRLSRRDLLNDTPFNTYTRAGLPPTPIALPGADALHAAVNPAPGDDIYFVSRGDGTHYFSASLADHQAAVRKYLLRAR
jgi:UPF0755 protein